MSTRQATTGHFRSTSALVLALGAVVLHTGQGPAFGVALLLWFCAALGIGLVLPRWWALLLAALPWPIGVGIALATGRYAFLGEGWQLAALLSVVTGLSGIALGVVIGRSLQRWMGRWVAPPATVAARGG